MDMSRLNNNRSLYVGAYDEENHFEDRGASGFTYLYGVKKAG